MQITLYSLVDLDILVSRFPETIPVICCNENDGGVPE